MKEVKKWNRLDNVAKIFPPTTSKRDTKVFRFACELNQTVDPNVLQRALDKTLPQFPLYCSILRKGLFWYYFERTTMHPKVFEEQDSPCGPIYDSIGHNLLFTVSYFGRRINLEIFHALSDGTGAIQFLRSLVYAYLAMANPLAFPNGAVLNDYDASADQRQLDAFSKYYDDNRKISGPRKTTAFRLQGEKLFDNRLGVIAGTMSAKAVLEKAHAYNATLSEFLTAVLILSIHENMSVRNKKKPVIITIPVDLRRFFPAQTARNFFGVIKVTHHFEHNGATLADIVKNTHKQFSEQLTGEAMLGIINKYSAIENNPVIKAIPLAIKIPCLRLAGWWEDRNDTAAFSNLGKIMMPEEAAKQIRLFDVFASTKRPQLCLCTFNDTLSLGFSSPLKNTAVQRCFFRYLSGMGIDIQIISNLETVED